MIAVVPDARTMRATASRASMRVAASSVLNGSSSRRIAGPHAHRARERHALLLAAGQLVRPALGHLGVQRDELEQLADARRPIAPARQGEADVAGDRQMREERAVLGHVADVSLVGRHEGLRRRAP